jgi:hypothetical protein
LIAFLGTAPVTACPGRCWLYAAKLLRSVRRQKEHSCRVWLICASYTSVRYLSVSTTDDNVRNRRRHAQTKRVKYELYEQRRLIALPLHNKDKRFMPQQNDNSVLQFHSRLEEWEIIWQIHPLISLRRTQSPLQRAQYFDTWRLKEDIISTWMFMIISRDWVFVCRPRHLKMELQSTSKSYTTTETFDGGQFQVTLSNIKDYLVVKFEPFAEAKL